MDRVKGRGVWDMNLLRSAATSGDAGLGERRRLVEVEEFLMKSGAKILLYIRQRLGGKACPTMHKALRLLIAANDVLQDIIRLQTECMNFKSVCLVAT